MTRRSPLDAAMWNQLIYEGEVRCQGCDEMVDLSSAEDINDGVELWNEHVRSCEEAPDQPEAE